MKMDRRRFLALSAAAALSPAAFLEASDRRLLQMGGYPINAETPLELLNSYITPNDLFFIRHHWNPVKVDPDAWTLTVEGEVSKPLRLTLDELRKMPRTSATCVLQCAGNGRALHNPPVPGLQWKYGAVGNARWTGVAVKHLLDLAGLRGPARHLHTSGSDIPPVKVPPFHRSLEIEKVLQDGIVAYEMNGQPLPHLHGAPARLIVPGWAGDHWMKWLTRLSAAPKPQTGFYMDTAYRYPRKPGAPGVTFKPEEMTPVRELFVKSNITSAPARAKLGVPSVIGGFAFSGAPDIAKVEITDDDGATWSRADLDPQHDPFAWRLWSFRWTPREAGRATLMARATDSRGSAQPREAVWNQSGYLFNGWPAAAVEVIS